MSYTYLPETPRARPAVVTAAVALLYVATAMLVVNALAAIALAGPMGDAMEEALRGQPDVPENFGSTFATFFVGISLAIYLVIAIVLVILAIFDGKGRNWARITTWVVTGLMALCCGCGGVFNAVSGGTTFSGSFTNTGGNATIDQQEMQRRLEESIPSWYTPVTATAAIVLGLIGIAVIILLALPASNAFFRKAPETWTPPSWPGAPGEPGYPQAPGYPQTGYPQAPGTPGAPGTDPGYPPPPGSYPPPPAQ